MTDPSRTGPQLRPDEIYLFLDFDGTLVDLAPTPDGIDVPDHLHSLLANLHDRLDGRLCLVSGREVATLERFLPGYSGDIFGAHGAESRRGGMHRPHRLVGSDTVADVHSKAQCAVDALPGTSVETKATGAVIHYRGAPQAEAAARQAALDIVNGTSGMELHPSKMAFEIRPDDVSKADAVIAIMQDIPPTIKPVVIGDDTTDEEAMAVANDRGGVAIRVGDGATCAAHRLADPAAVLDWLKALSNQGDL